MGPQHLETLREALRLENAALERIASGAARLGSAERRQVAVDGGVVRMADPSLVRSARPDICGSSSPGQRERSPRTSSSAAVLRLSGGRQSALPPIPTGRGTHDREPEYSVLGLRIRSGTSPCLGAACISVTYGPRPVCAPSHPRLDRLFCQGHVHVSPRRSMWSPTARDGRPPSRSRPSLLARL